MAMQTIRHMMPRLTIFVLAVLTAVVTQAFSQAARDNKQTCFDFRPDLPTEVDNRIDSCLLVIGDNRIDADIRAEAHMRRALAYAQRAEQLNNTGDIDRALADLAEGIHLDPNNPAAQYFVLQTRASLYYHKGDYERAIAAYSDLIGRDPDTSALYTYRGIVFATKGDHANAISDFNEAIRREPNADLYTQRALSYLQAGKLAEALADADRAVALAPEDATTYAPRVVINRAAGKTADVIRDLRKALSLDPSNELIKSELQSEESKQPVAAAKPVEAASSPAATAFADSRRDYELAAQVGTREAWEAYLRQYPAGFYAELARAQLHKLGGAAPADDAKLAREQEQERTAKQQVERERVEKERVAREQAEQARVASEKVERERLETERVAREKTQREEAARAEAERKRLAEEKAAREKALAAEAEREKQRLAREQAERERAEKERVAREQAEQKRQEQARIAAEQARKADDEKAARERAAVEEKAAKEKAAAEKQAQEAAAQAKAADEARLAAEKAKEAEQARLAEEARVAESKKQVEAAKATELDAKDKPADEKPAGQLALLTSPDKPDDGKPNAEQISRLLLTELRRLGCFRGSIDGSWNEAAQKSVKLFNKHAGTTLDTKVASFDTLDMLKHRSERVCPLVCEHGYKPDGDTCAKIICRSGYELGDDNSCEKMEKRRPVVRREAPSSEPKEAPESHRRQAQSSGQTYCNQQGCFAVRPGCRISRERGGGSKGGQQREICP
jgi:Tfp pilus assembly protein PilF